MNAYQLLLFAHVLGAVGIFSAIAVEAVALGSLRRAETVADARLWMRRLALPARVGPVAMGATLVSGIGMMAMVWDRRPWIVGAFLGLVTMAGLGGGISGRRLRRVRAALASEIGSDLSDGLRALRSGNALAASLRLRVAIGIAILALMSFKPDVAGSTLILAAGMVAGLLAGRVALAMGRSRPAAASAEATEP